MPSGTLPGLDRKWSLGESWLNTVTVGAGLLTGIFGSTGVVKSIIGEDADAKIALAVVGAAIAVALIAAAPLVLGVFRSRDGDVTAYGLLLAAALTLTGAVGQLWTVGETADSLGIEFLYGRLLAYAAIALVAVYSLVTLRGILAAGRTAPAPPGPSDFAKAAAVIAEAILTQKRRAGVPGRGIVYLEGRPAGPIRPAPAAPARPLWVEPPAPVERRRAALL